MEEELAGRAAEAISQKTFPGCVIGVVRNGQQELWPFGRLTYDETSPEVGENTIYDLASITKSIPVAALAAMFVAQGKLNPNDKVVRYIPELQNDRDATVEDLLRYRVRGPRMSHLKYQTFEQVRTHIVETGFDGPSGGSDYTNLPAFLLGIILERVGGKILPALAHTNFFGPLEMKGTSFFPRDYERIAPTEVVDGVEIRGIVHDESARLFALRRRAVGHAGLFSTAPDLLKFLAALVQGTFPPVLEAAKQGLGWQRFEHGTFGKTGFTGTYVAVDPEQKIGLVVLSNRTYPKRPGDTSAITALRTDIANLVFTS